MFDSLALGAAFPCITVSTYYRYLYPLLLQMVLSFQLIYVCLLTQPKIEGPPLKSLPHEQGFPIL